MLKVGMIPHNLKNKIYLVFSLLVLLLLLTQCGLNTYPYIYPPNMGPNPLTGSDSPCYILNRGDNDPDVFLGYELYYKFYNFSDATSAMATDDRSIFSVEQPTPSDVTRLGFRRVNNVSNTDQTTRYPMIPLIFADRNRVFNLTFDFTGVSPDTAENIKVIPNANYLNNSGNPISVNLYRQVTDPDDDSVPRRNNYKSFGDLRNDISGSRDSDLPGNSVTLSLYVFAYGKYNKVYNIYSKPLWLGYINYMQR